MLINNQGSGAGAANRPGELCEVIFSLDGRDIVRKPVRVLLRGASGALDEGEISNVSGMIYGDSYVIVYSAANAAGDLSLGVASSPLRNPANTFHAALPFPIPSDVATTADTDFTALSARPSGYTKVGNVTETYSGGLNVALTGASDEFYLFNDDGFRGDLTDFVDIYWKDWRSVGSGAGFYQPYIGFVDSKGLRSTWQNGLFISADEATGNVLNVHRLVAGVKSSQASTTYTGFGYGTAPGSESKKNIGLRWWPTQNRAIILGEGNVEMEEVSIDTGFDLSKTLYPVIGFMGTAGGLGTMRVGHIGIRQKENQPTVAANPVTISGTPTDLRDASNASVYNFASTPVDIGSPAANRYVFVTAGITGPQTTPVATGMTAALNVNGTLVPMTRIGFYFTDEFYGTVKNVMAAFMLQVPDNVTTVIPQVTLSGGPIAGRAFCSVVAAKGVNPASVAFAKAGSVRGADNYSVPIAKSAGGLVLAAQFNSTSGASLSNGAYEIPIANLAAASIGTSSNNAGTQAWSGIANTISASTLVESGGLGGSALVAISLAPLS